MRPVFIHSENEREFRLFQSTERDWAAYPRSPFVLRDRVWEASPNSLCEKFPIKGLAGEQIFVPFSVYNFHSRCGHWPIAFNTAVRQSVV